MNLNNKHVAVLVYNYFEQAEFDEPISALKDAGAEVTVIATDKLDLQALNHVDKGDKFKADLLLADASSGDYDGLVLPGGVFNADNLRINEDAKDWVIDFLETGRVVAAICHAPWLLVSADVVEGRRLTSFHTIQDDIVNAGGDWVNQAVVVDNNLITSRIPDDLPEFNRALIKALSQTEPVDLEDNVETLAGSEIRNVRRRDLTIEGYDSAYDEVSSSDGDLIDGLNVDDEEQLHPSSVVPEDERD